MSHCLLCGEPFVPRPTHPMAELLWCGACWPTIRERVELYGYPGLLKRAEGSLAEDV